MRESLTSRLKNARSTLVEECIGKTGLQAALSARYGYGLTVTSENSTYFFHLPDAASDPVQAAMLRSAAFPDEELLLRLRRRTHPQSVIIDVCSGAGARAVFYAGSMQAGRVHALAGSRRMADLTRKNALLNDLDGAIRAQWLSLSGEKAKGAVASVDRYGKDQKLDKLDLLSVNAQGLAAVTRGGAETQLRQHGPAVIVWAEGADPEQLRQFQDLLQTLGYKEPETWSADVLYWAPRV